MTRASLLCRAITHATFALASLASASSIAMAGPEAASDGERSSEATALDEGAPIYGPRVAPLTLSTLPGRLALPPREVAFKLDAPDTPRFSLLLPFRDASIERLGPLKVYTTGRWGRRALAPWLSLPWSSSVEPRAPAAEAIDLLRDPGDELTFSSDGDLLATPGLAGLVWRPSSMRPRAEISAFFPTFENTGNSLRSGGFDVLFRLPEKPVADWRCRRQPVTFMRYGNETDRFELVRCDGSIAPFALDKLTIVARPPEAARPEGGLPDEPDPTSWSERREWTPGVRLVHPRLLWALQRIADAFPRRGIYIYSGYRPFAEVNDGSHHRSQHATGRAVDISLQGIAKEELFKVCRTLKDVGCGFYPNGKFVHVDVRTPHSGGGFWIDASGPGEPARYVDSWPGVVEAPAGSSEAAAASSAAPAGSILPPTVAAPSLVAPAP